MKETMRYIPGSLSDPTLDVDYKWAQDVSFKHAPELYSQQYRWKQVAEIVTGLYDWYKTVSQPSRRWQTLHPTLRLERLKTRNPNAVSEELQAEGDRVIWKNIRSDHNPHIKTIIDGFRRVEHYAPDYVNSILDMLAKLQNGKGLNYARRLFALAWGDEEAGHARAWTYASLSTKIMTPGEVVEDEIEMHGRGEFVVPPDNIFKMIAYVVVQELATQVSYRNFGKLVKPAPDNPSSDKELYKLSGLIGRDESAHFKFFREVADVVMVYFPGEMTEAILHVTDPAEFRMPSKESIPKDKYTRFERAAAVLGVLNPTILARDVFAKSLASMGMEDREAWVKRLADARAVKDSGGEGQATHQFGIELPDEWINAHIEGLNQGNRGTGLTEKVNQLYRDAEVEEIVGLLQPISKLRPIDPSDPRHINYGQNKQSIDK